MEGAPVVFVMPATEEATHGLLAEGLWPPDRGAAMTEHGCEFGSAECVGPGRADQRHGQIGEPSGQVVQETQAGSVGPLCVIHHEEQRVVLGDVGGNPVQAMHHGEDVAAAVLSDVWPRVEQRCGETAAAPERISVRRATVTRRRSGSNNWTTTPKG